MQVLLNADPHTDGRHEMAGHVDAVVHAALQRFGGAVHRVEAHLSSASQHRHLHGSDAVACTLEARLAGLAVVVASDQAAHAHQAIQGAADKLQRAVASALARHDPVRGAVALKDLDLDVPGQDAGETGG